MIEPRLYRAAFIPAVLAVVLTMFSLESRPPPVEQGLAADVVFEGEQGTSAARRVLGAGEDRRAGTGGDRAAAALVARSFRSRGFETERDEFEHDGRRLVNVVARRAGRSARQVVVLAARDATGVPDAAGSAADTGALLEVARVFEGRPSTKGLTLASVDGEQLGQVGARRFAQRLGPPGQVAGVVVLSGFAAPGDRAASVQAWSIDDERAGIGLQRTVADSLREEVGEVGPTASALGQLARLAFPLGIGSQAVLIAEGYDTVRIGGAGELPPAASAEIDTGRFEDLGRATLRTLTALDAGAPPRRGPSTYVTVASQVLPGWVIALLSFTLILPALVAAVDAFARIRRRQEPISAWLAWLGAGVLPFVSGLGLAHLLALAGLVERSAAPIAPSLLRLDAAGGISLALIAVVVALAWIALRYLVVRADSELGDPTAPGAGVAVALVLSAAALALWAVNPFAALLMVPALHLWSTAVLIDPPLPRPVRLTMLAGGFLAPALLGLYVLLSLELDPLSAAWYVLALIVGGQVPLAQVLVGCVIAGIVCAVFAIVRRRRRAPDGDEGPSVRGPVSYLGPGSLGGTSSATPRR